MTNAERLENLALSYGFKGIEWTDKTVDFPWLISPENKVRLPEQSCDGSMCSFDLYGQHDLLHAKQIATGRLWRINLRTYVFDNEIFVMDRVNNYPSCKRISDGKWFEFCPWEEDAMRFDE